MCVYTVYVPDYDRKYKKVIHHNVLPRLLKKNSLNYSESKYCFLKNC